MPVTARFTPESIDLRPDAASRVTLRLHNNGDEATTVTLNAAGDLAEHLTLASTTATLESNQTVDIGVELRVAATVEAKQYAPGVEVVSDGATVVASLAADVVAHHQRTVELRPAHSRGATVGRHVVRVANNGNEAITLSLAADSPDERIRIELPSSLTVDAGSTGEAAVRAVATSTFWTGTCVDHEFTVLVRDAEAVAGNGSEPTPEALVGTFEQRPRVPNWLGPAAAGAAMALLVGAIAWFALLRPWVDDRADQAAADAIEADRAAMQERIDELERAAAEARELPLGEPFDLRLDVAPAGGDEDEASELIDTGSRFSVTDIVFQNPAGAVGTMTLLRDGEMLLQSETANFRDFDLHLVAPFVFNGGSEITLRVDCRTPGPDGSDCAVGAAVLGFLDEID